MTSIQRDHCYRFDGPARRWIDGLPLGNGRIGVMCVTDARRDRYSINDDTAWSGTIDSEFTGGRVEAPEAAEAVRRARSAVLEDPVEADRAVRTLQQRWSQSYQPLASLVVDTPIANGRSTVSRTLDFTSAEHVARLDYDGLVVTRRAFVSAPDRAFVLTQTSLRPISIMLRLETPQRIRRDSVSASGAELVVSLPIDVAPFVDDIREPVRWADDPAASVAAVVCAEWTHDGTATVVGGDVHLHDVRELTVRVSTATTFTGMGRPHSRNIDGAVARVRDTLAAAADIPVATLRRRHVDDHRALYDRARLTFGTDTGAGPDDAIDRVSTARHDGDGDAVAADPGLLAQLWNYGRYLLIASSRPGTLPANLQGIWNDDLRPEWSCNFTTNINVQMNYWGAEVADLGELHEPLFDLIDVLADRGEEKAARLYGARGWAVHHNADAWGFGSPVGAGTHTPKWAFWPMGGVWLARHLMEHVRHGGSEPAQRRAYRVLRGAVQFVLDWGEEVDRGEFGTMLSTSPEVDFVTASPDGVPTTAAVARSASMDLELIRDGLEMLIALAGRLGIEDDVVERARRVRDMVPAPRIGRDGATEEWRDEQQPPTWEQPHVSLHYGLFPGDRPFTREEAVAASSSLDRRGGDRWDAWAVVWRIALRARLQEPESVGRLLRRIFPDPNEPYERGEQHRFRGLTASPFQPFHWYQLDANLGVVGVIPELLFQSHDGSLRLLPCLPAALADGEAKGLIARPGVAIDMQWRAGRVTRCAITPRVPGTLAIHWPGGQTVATLTPGVTQIIVGETPRPEERRRLAPGR